MKCPACVFEDGAAPAMLPSQFCERRHAGLRKYVAHVQALIDASAGVRRADGRDRERDPVVRDAGGLDTMSTREDQPIYSPAAAFGRNWTLAAIEDAVAVMDAAMTPEQRMRRAIEAAGFVLGSGQPAVLPWPR